MTEQPESAKPDPINSRFADLIRNTFGPMEERQKAADQAVARYEQIRQDSDPSIDS